MLSAILRVAKSAQGGGYPYFRLRATDAPWSGGLQALYEVQLYESADATGVNLALAATKTASDYSTNQPNGAGDGSTFTYWQSLTGASASVAWWRCQFAGPKTVRSVVIKPHTQYYAKSYALEQSLDGVAWTTIKTVATSGVAGAVQTYLAVQP